MVSHDAEDAAAAGGPVIALGSAASLMEEGAALTPRLHPAAAEPIV
jgi:hypothetical protein